MNLFATIVPIHADYVWSLVLMYIGPDVLMPLTSALAAVAGFLLMFWHRVLGFVMRLMGKGAPSSGDATTMSSDSTTDHQKRS